MPTLDQPITLPCGQVLPNRILKAAMSEQLGDKDFLPVPGVHTLFQRWAQGGSGVLITGNVMVDSHHLGEPDNIVLEATQSLEPFRNWAQATQETQAKLWMQLNHPGKQSPRTLNKSPLAPSALPLGKGLDKLFATPRALIEAEIEDIIQRFAASAKMAKDAGFDGVQIHAAHGYLISQFLSPKHNQREDGWGGDIDGRMRMLLAVYDAIREGCGADFAISVKLNSADFQRGGFSAEDAQAVAKALDARGVDLLELSGGSYEQPAMMTGKIKASTKAREAYFLDFAKELRGVFKGPLAVTGGFRSSAAMRSAISEGAVDVVGVARPLAIEPDFAAKALADAEYKITLPVLKTGIQAIDRSAMFDISWYEVQLRRMAAGKMPKPSLSLTRTWLSTLWSMGPKALKKRRA